MGAAIAALWQGHRAVIVTVAAALVVVGMLAVVERIYVKGETAGAATVINAVQSKQIETTTKAQQRKDQVDNEVAKTPYKSAVDQLD